MEIERVFDGTPVTLRDVLDNKERRAERQRALLADGMRCLVCFTLNIPGEIKQFPLARAAFEEGLAAMRDAFGATVAREEIVDRVTGCEAMLVLDADPCAVKAQTTAMEDAHPLGRLFDMDVLNASGEPLSRKALGAPPRRCLICGRDAKLCGRSRAHSMDALRLEIARRLSDHFRNRAADVCARHATRALLYEVSTTPKPGLVDRNNSGSHTDMDFFTFLDSSAALCPWFREMYCIGWECPEESPESLFARLRFAGREAERSMFASTGGVNTHKGLIFSLGLLCGALGATRGFAGEKADLNAALALCAKMGTLALHDLEMADGGTNGERCYRQYRVTGIRGEAAQGFPSARNIGLPAIRKWTEAGLSLNDASALALLALIAGVTDTNMIKRGGVVTAERRRQEAALFLREITRENYPEKLRALDDSYIAENLSPGGCADLLAISLMLYFIGGPIDVND
ncbi:MAG: citrate lyase holo-[Oscillospiraceae bacterium]|nr:citrate lyase holo-[acyl-carrier protein] synthase [Oscillospiraceae bacterium]